MSRRARAGFLSDIQTLGNSYIPIGTIIPIFKADHPKVTDNGVVLQLGAVVDGAGGGSGYTTNLSDPNGFETLPITLEINSGNFSVSTETISYTDHGFITGDKLTVIETSQADIAEALTGDAGEFDHKQIVLDEAIKQLGVYSVPVKLHAEVEVTAKVWVVKA